MTHLRIVRISNCNWRLEIPARVGSLRFERFTDAKRHAEFPPLGFAGRWVRTRELIDGKTYTVYTGQPAEGGGA